MSKIIITRWYKLKIYEYYWIDIVPRSLSGFLPVVMSNHIYKWCNISVMKIKSLNCIVLLLYCTVLCIVIVFYCCKSASVLVSELRFDCIICIDNCCCALLWISCCCLVLNMMTIWWSDRIYNEDDNMIHIKVIPSLFLICVTVCCQT